MQTNNHEIIDYDEVLDAKFGKKGTPSRIEAEEKAIAFYTGQIIEQAGKEAKMTQTELAEKIGSNKSYISRVETGRTEPKITTFYRIASALGRSIELNPI
jgi:DNA-binding XRE family transcriptional regulator